MGIVSLALAKKTLLVPGVHHLNSNFSFFTLSIVHVPLVCIVFTVFLDKLRYGISLSIICNLVFERLRRLISIGQLIF